MHVSVLEVLSTLVLTITVAYSVPSMKVVAHEVLLWHRNRRES